MEMCELPPPHQGVHSTGAAVARSVGNEPQADGDNGGANKDTQQDGGAERVVIDKYSKLREAVAQMGLEKAWDMTPLLRVSEVPMRLGYF